MTKMDIKKKIKSITTKIKVGNCCFSFTIWIHFRSNESKQLSINVDWVEACVHSSSNGARRQCRRRVWLTAPPRYSWAIPSQDRLGKPPSPLFHCSCWAAKLQALAPFAYIFVCLAPLLQMPVCGWPSKWMKTPWNVSDYIFGVAQKVVHIRIPKQGV